MCQRGDASAASSTAVSRAHAATQRPWYGVAALSKGAGADWRLSPSAVSRTQAVLICRFPVCGHIARRAVCYLGAHLVKSKGI